MPAKGKHRRPKSQRFTRSIAAAGTGGAALALPLVGAAGAQAATPTAAVSGASEKTATIATEQAAAEAGARIEQVEKAAQAERTATKKTAKTYSVKVGDYLAKIADEHDVDGGWKRLYSDNRGAIGSDPSLIHPGLKLSIGGQAASGGTSQSSKPQLSQSSKPAESSPSPKPSAPAKQESKDTQASTATSTATSNGQSSSANSSGFSLPIQGATVGTPYKRAGSMWSSGYHTGVDFVAPTGTALKAVGAGTVVSAGWGGAYGNQVVIRLADGYYAQYAHLSSISVSAGQTVSGGQQIGLSGATGNVTGPHLHFEIRTTPSYGSDLDPLAYLRSKGVSV